MEDAHARVTVAVERELYTQAIKLAEGDQTKAARWLGVSRPTMREKLLRYNLHSRLEFANEFSGSRSIGSNFERHQISLAKQSG